VAACGGREVAERPRSGGDGGRRALAAYGFGRRRRLRLGENLGHEGGGFIGQPRRLGVRARGPRGADGVVC
jgi:hypothetical protein